MFDSDSWESMQGYRFNDLRVHQEEFYRRSKSNRLCHPLQNYSSESTSCESNSCNFINVEWVYTDPVVREDYSPYENNSPMTMYLADCSETDCSAKREVDLVDTILNGGYDVEFSSANNIEDYGLTQDFPTLECEFARVSDVDQVTTEGCYKRGYHVGYNARLDCPKSIEDRCDILCKDAQEFWDEGCDRTLPKSFASFDQVPDERPKHALHDESFQIIPCTVNYEWDDNRSRDGLDDFPESQCNYTKLGTETQPGLNEQIRDERYWKRRKKNNKAAKKSRTAKKSRFALMEKRIEELEVENAEKKEQLRILKQKISEKDGKSVST